MTPEQERKVEKAFKKFNSEKYPCRIEWGHWPLEPGVVTVVYHNMTTKYIHIRPDGSTVMTTDFVGEL